MAQQRHTLKAKLQSGHLLRGCFLTLPSADVAEILANAGFDFLLIDHEHGSGDITDAIGQMRAMLGSGTSAMVRIRQNDAALIKRTLDAGANALLCPMVECREDAEAVVQACFFPPLGSRGAGGGTRASRYGYDAAYHSTANDRLLIVAQIESRRGVANIEEIAAVAGIDMLLIGPRDLSSTMGKLNQFQDPEVLAVVADAEARIKRSGKYLGSVIYPGLTAQAMFDKGCHMVITGSDVGILSTGAKQLLSS
jgi:4-hydroxy-2-oxoheptanedioate aldolase